MLYFLLVIGTLVFCLVVGLASVFRVKSFNHVVAIAALVTFAVLFGTGMLATSWRLDVFDALRYSVGIAFFDAAVFLFFNWMVGRKQRLAPKAKGA
jgi:hypothetical protein